MAFAEYYSCDARLDPGNEQLKVLEKVADGAPGLRRFLQAYSGSSFNQGVYRVHRLREIPRWTGLVGEAFPEFQRRILCFGYDWLGRQFALDVARRRDGEFLVLLLEPGTGEALEIPATFQEFHDLELVNNAAAALADEAFQSWLAAGGEAPAPDECIGYRTPLFLGGDDEFDNMEKTDLEVYWSLCGQLLAKVRDLPEGTPITGIDIGNAFE